MEFTSYFTADLEITNVLVYQNVNRLNTFDKKKYYDDVRWMIRLAVLLIVVKCKENANRIHRIITTVGVCVKLVVRLGTLVSRFFVLVFL